jgi:hypothetical protein
MKIYSLIVFLIVSSFNVKGTDTFFNGKAPFHPNRSLTIYTVQDFLTRTQEKISEIKVSNDGEFEIKLDLEKTSYLLFDFGKVKRYMYAQPGQKYKLLIETIEAKIVTSESIYALDERPMNILQVDSNELNNVMLRIDADIAKFTLENGAKLLSGSPIKEVDQLASRISKKYPLNSSNFLSLYTEYRLAEVYQICYKGNKALFRTDYLLSKPTYADNPAYMKVFRDQFTKYLRSNIDQGFSQSIYQLINDNNYHGLMEKIYPTGGQYADQLKELLVLNLFYENFGNQNFNPQMVKNLLAKLQVNTRSASNKLVATNIIRRIKELTPGSEAPSFALYDVDSNLIQLSDFKEKKVYLSFTESWSRSFELDVKIMNQWKEKYPDLEIITIIVDRDMSSYAAFIAKNQPNWTIVHAGLTPTVMLDYKLTNNPSFFLIGEDGELLLSPAKSPYEGFEQQYADLLQGN